MSPLFLAFLGVAALITVTPGPDMAVTTRNALAHGPRGVFLTTAGITLALALWITASAIGLAALLRASAPLFLALKLLGGCYLAYLGIRAWIDSRRLHGDFLATTAAPPAAGSLFRQGLLSAGSNPKLGVFFVTFLPQFTEPGRPLLPQLLALGATFAVIGLTWLNLYGLLVVRVRDVVTAPRVRRWMERVTGTVVIGLGARLVIERA